MNEEHITASAFRAKNSNTLPTRADDFSKYSFWQYTRLKTVDLILSTESFRVSNLNGMNDLDEAKQHETERERVFSLCFCNSNTEKIPLWYLYSGLDGKGATVGFTPARMMKWLNSIKTVYGVKDGQEKKEGDILSVGSDVEMQYGWVYYQKPQEPQKVKYRNKWFEVDDLAEFQKDNYFIKYYPWEYEREFRIVFINKSQNDYDALFVDVPKELMKDSKVRLAPELKQSKFEKITGLSCVGVTHTPLYSGLAIRMNLFKRNIASLYDYLRDEFAATSPDVEANKICEMIEVSGRCKKNITE